MKLSSGSVVTDDLTARLGALAHKSNVTIVGVTETVPSGTSYQNWMLQLLDGTKCFLSLAATRGSPWAGHEAADQQDSCNGRQQRAVGPARAPGGRSPRQPACHAKTGAMHLADRGYDADWIRALVSEHGAWADIPPRRNRKDALCFSRYLYRARNLVERFFNKTKQCQRVARRYTSSQLTPPQPSLPMIRQVILTALAMPPPTRCPHCCESLPANNLPM
jgi:transposase